MQSALDKAYFLFIVFTIFTYSGTLCAKSLASLEAVTAKADSLGQFLNSPALLEEYGRAVQAYYGTQRFNCQTYKQVIEELRALNKKVPSIAQSIWRSWEGQNSILVLTQAGYAYNFRSVPRKLHGLWSYTSTKSCENEVCSNLFKEQNRGTVLLGRWASTLAGSQVHLIEKNGSYTGMAILLTPYQKEGRVFGLIDAYGDRKALSRQIKTRHQQTGKSVRISLLDAWLQKMSSVRPDWLAGFILPVAPGGDNVSLANAFSPLRLQPQLNKNEYLPVDSLAKQVGIHLAKQCGFNPTTKTGLLPSAANNFGGFFQVAVGDANSNADGSGLEIFAGEIEPGLIPGTNGELVVAGNPSDELFGGKRAQGGQVNDGKTEDPSNPDNIKNIFPEKFGNGKGGTRFSGFNGGNNSNGKGTGDSKYDPAGFGKGFKGKKSYKPKFPSAKNSPQASAKNLKRNPGSLPGASDPEGSPNSGNSNPRTENPNSGQAFDPSEPRKPRAGGTDTPRPGDDNPKTPPVVGTDPQPPRSHHEKAQRIIDLLKRVSDQNANNRPVDMKDLRELIDLGGSIPSTFRKGERIRKNIRGAISQSWRNDESREKVTQMFQNLEAQGSDPRTNQGVIDLTIEAIVDINHAAANCPKSGGANE